MVAASATSPLTVLGSSSLTAYWRFQRAVVAAQLQAWLPPRGRILVDISGPQSSVASQAATAGYTVLQVLPRWPSAAVPPGSGHLAAGHRAPGDPVPGNPAQGDPAPGGPALRDPVPGRPARLGVPRTLTVRGVHRRRSPAGRLVRVVADSANLSFLADGSVDGVIADGALSRHLMAEDVAAEIARVLRPGGQLLASVDSLVLGMSILAEQHHWAELTDLPQAEVVLVPWPDGRITRCFGPDQLVDLLTEAGLEVSWIRPRTVLSPSMVDHVLRKDPSAIMRLVRAELAAGAEEAGTAGPGHDGRHGGNESFGIHLLAAARKPAARDAPAASQTTAG
jgi:SAM-dependent methyltransferase